MKIKFLLIYGIIMCILCSCVSNHFYQVYQVTPSEEIVKKDNLLVFEDENCMILYNLWGDKGNIGFKIYNKSNENLFLDLEDSFFILNGEAFNYYLSRTYTNVKSNRVGVQNEQKISIDIKDNYFVSAEQVVKSSLNSAESVNVTGHSVSHAEERVVCIPPESYKSIMEYSINSNLYRDCKILRFPKNKDDSQRISFSKSESPFVFANKLTYTVGNSEKRFKINHSFYVSEITNLPHCKMVVNRDVEFCGDKSQQKEKVLINNSPDKFYIKYSKNSNEVFKH